MDEVIQTMPTGTNGLTLDRTKSRLMTIKAAAILDEKPLPLSSEECLDLVWDLTVETWSLMGDFDAEQRLRRDIVHFYRKEG